MDLHPIIEAVTHFVQQWRWLAYPLFFLLSFGESLAFISLLLPATVILLALSTLIGESGLAFMPLWLCASTGAFLGSWLSYWIGYRYQHRIEHWWPFSRHPELLARGHRFFERFGVMGVFIGHFFGPLRAIVPLVAGICTMPARYFQLANLLSSLLWAFVVIAPGGLGLPWLQGWLS